MFQSFQMISLIRRRSILHSAKAVFTAWVKFLQSSDLIDKPPIFFTAPPIPYPYILVNAHNPTPGFHSLRISRKVARMVILDSGIEIFRDPNIKDYPNNWAKRLLKLYGKIKATVPKATVYAVAPDYCDDYHPRALWLSPEQTNIERTVQNAIFYTGKFPHVNWILSIQGWYQDPQSPLRCIKLYDKYGLLKDFEYFAIGNFCMELETIKGILLTIANWLRNKRLHVFDLKLRVLPAVQATIFSFDSFAWTRPVSKSKLKANWSCKNNEERIRFFKAWLARVNEIKSQRSLLEFVRE